jgi:hypothetical protein
MGTAFPGALDGFDDNKIVDLEDALKAVEAKVGVTASTVPTSLEYRLGQKQDVIPVGTYVRVNEGPLSLRDSRVGAVLNGVADDTNALVAARNLLPTNGGTIYHPGGTLRTTAPFNPTKNGFKLVGSSRFDCTILNEVSDVFTIAKTASLSGFWLQGIKVRATAGHVFDVGAAGVGMSRSALIDVYIEQANTAKSIWNQPAGLFLDMLVMDCELTGVTNHSVPLWKVVTADGGANCNLFLRLRCNHSGDYFFHFESTVAGSYVNDNTFQDINFEMTTGGNIRLLSANNCTVRQCDTYDLPIVGPTTKDLFLASKTTGPTSIENRFEQCFRRGGALGAGLHDIKLAAGAVGRTRVDSCGGSIDLGSTPENIVMALSTNIGTIVNPGADNLDVRPDGLRFDTAQNRLTAGAGTPEGVVTAPPGSMFLRSDGGAGTTLYIKETGTGSTGWVAK